MSEGWTNSFLDVEPELVPRLERMGYERGIYEGEPAWWKDSEGEFLRQEAIQLSKDYLGKTIHFYWQSWRDGTPECHNIYENGRLKRMWVEGTVGVPGDLANLGLG